jgi:rubredoxin
MILAQNRSSLRNEKHDLLAERYGGFSAMKHVCVLCGYEYNPKLGDPENGINEGVDFEDLPEDWVCPLCGASKEDFERINDNEHDADEI